MLIKLCLQNQITPICTVRRAEQAKLLEGAKYVVDTSKKDYKKVMANFCIELNPKVCFECISGETTGEMLDYMGFGSTLILYGLLSEKPAGGINTIAFLGKS